MNKLNQSILLLLLVLSLISANGQNVTTYTTEVGLDYPGNDIAFNGTIPFSQCPDWCTSVSNCVGIALFLEHGSGCWIKFALLNRSVNVNRNSLTKVVTLAVVTSATAAPSNFAPTFVNNSVPNAFFSGQNVLIIAAASAGVLIILGAIIVVVVINRGKASAQSNSNANKGNLGWQRSYV